MPVFFLQSLARYTSKGELSSVSRPIDQLSVDLVVKIVLFTLRQRPEQLVSGRWVANSPCSCHASFCNIASVCKLVHLFEFYISVVQTLTSCFSWYDQIISFRCLTWCCLRFRTYNLLLLILWWINLCYTPMVKVEAWLVESALRYLWIISYKCHNLEDVPPSVLTMILTVNSYFVYYHIFYY